MIGSTGWNLPKLILIRIRKFKKFLTVWRDFWKLRFEEKPVSKQAVACWKTKTQLMLKRIYGQLKYKHCYSIKSTFAIIKSYYL